MAHHREPKTIRCSFCGRDGSEVTSMVAGPDVYICDICIKTSVEILKNNISSFGKKDTINLSLTPELIKKSLDEYVIDQELANSCCSSL